MPVSCCQAAKSILSGSCCSLASADDFSASAAVSADHGQSTVTKRSRLGRRPLFTRGIVGQRRQKATPFFLAMQRLGSFAALWREDAARVFLPRVCLANVVLRRLAEA